MRSITNSLTRAAQVAGFPLPGLGMAQELRDFLFR